MSKRNTNCSIKSHFIRTAIEEDKATGLTPHIVMRFPPEPNGYLHIGHAKSICLNFGLSKNYGGKCYLRLDDTNPTGENITYVEAIKANIKWLGFEWDNEPRYTSDYFGKLYAFAEQLIEKGLAFVCELTPAQMRDYRGSLTATGSNSPWRDRSSAENLTLFREMKSGQHAEGRYVLRAKIDMASPNMNMRDPVMYRILHQNHYRTGDEWCIYPTYDFSHSLCDALDGVTHSLCSLEFEDHRPLYDWFVQHVHTAHNPRQIEFARLHLSHTVLSKRKLKKLVASGKVCDWSDPRMPTLEGMKRRGYPPVAIRRFCDAIGVAKTDSIVDLALLEHEVRSELNKSAPRVMAVLDPIRLVITNYPPEQEEELSMPKYPNECNSNERRSFTFTHDLYIERSDFHRDPPAKYKRLAVGRWVRLRGGYTVHCDDYTTDDDGRVREVHCHYDPHSLGVKPDGYKVHGVIHWVAKHTAWSAEVRLYEPLFLEEDADFLSEPTLNPHSMRILSDCQLDPSLKEAQGSFQFERLGYFCADSGLSSGGKKIFHRIVALQARTK